MGWDGVGWDGMGWDGMGWDGMGWDGFGGQAGRSLMRNFSPAVAGFSQAGALMSLNVAVATYLGCRKTSAALGSKVFNRGVSELRARRGDCRGAGTPQEAVFCARMLETFKTDDTRGVVVTYDYAVPAFLLPGLADEACMIKSIPWITQPSRTRFCSSPNLGSACIRAQEY